MIVTVLEAKGSAASGGVGALSLRWSVPETG
jgi:hypothetical protein